MIENSLIDFYMTNKVVSYRIHKGNDFTHKVLSLTSKDVENKCKDLSYSGVGLAKSTRTESEIAFSPFVQTFYLYVAKYDTIPTQYEFIWDYLICHNFFENEAYRAIYKKYKIQKGENDPGNDIINSAIEYLRWVKKKNHDILSKDSLSNDNLPQNCSQIGHQKGHAFDIRYLIARLLRTFPSLIRDLHSYLTLYESKKFPVVHYSIVDDVQNNVDLTVINENMPIKIGFFVNTKRAQRYANVKKTERHTTVPDLYFLLDPHDSKDCGNIKLYSESAFRELIDEIKCPEKRKFTP